MFSLNLLPINFTAFVNTYTKTLKDYVYFDICVQFFSVTSVLVMRALTITSVSCITTLCICGAILIHALIFAKQKLVSKCFIFIFLLT